MPRTSSTRLIAADVDTVWRTLSRFAELSQWGPGVDQSSLLTRTSEGVGTTRRVQVGRNTLRETVTDWAPGRRLAYTITGLPPLVREASNTWELAAQGSMTRVTLTSEVRTKGGPVLDRIVLRKLGSVGEQLLAGLAAARISA